MKVEVEKKTLQWALINEPGRCQMELEEVGEVTDTELGDAVKPQCYEEIKRLVKMEKNPIYAKALGEWSREESLITQRVQQKETRVSDLMNEIYHLTGSFIVIQCLLYTAVNQSNLLLCNNWWSPVLLSAVASIVTIFGVVQKFSRIEINQKTIQSEKKSLKEVAARLKTLRNEGVDNFGLSLFKPRADKEQSNFRFRVYFWLFIGSLIIFTVGFPFLHWRILCHSGSNP